ncbi:Glu/Leu/Phe/Val dehydrogenase dimerization domain-containing protein [Umezawaea sp. NPDC059074]|uniref:Glu/Leu/Phe/Val dehydrogenase dimerization domain-containing protein n=1 Tax=Umezawaea sp. NPDC059074 TaxID=3346716 RepID=UPI0036AEC3F1
MWEHEELVVRRGRRSGVTTMVAVHSRALGPAVGGTRLKAYPDLDAAVHDVLRLSRAMTDKCAVAGVRFGGGKSVIALAEGEVLTAARRRDVLLDHADLIASFDGGYRTGPDVGTGPEDMLVLREITPYSSCLPESHGGVGSSSAPTAVGVLASLRAAARQVFGSADVTGKRVVIAGFGSVGEHLAAGLTGADVTVSDIDPRRERLARDLGYGWVAPEKALATPADILVPAAVGGVLAADTDLGASLVVGPANNQLTDDAVAADLAARGVTWVPDFVASAGGIVYVLAREVDGLSHEAALARVEAIGETVAAILAAATAAGTTPLREATALAARRLAA